MLFALSTRSLIDRDICDAILDVLGLSELISGVVSFICLEQGLSELHCSWIYIFHATFIQQFHNLLIQTATLRTKVSGTPRTKSE